MVWLRYFHRKLVEDYYQEYYYYFCCCKTIIDDAVQSILFSEVSYQSLQIYYYISVLLQSRINKVDNCFLICHHWQ